MRFRDEVFDNSLRTSGIQYGSARNVIGEVQPLLLDFYEPAGDTIAKRPLVLFLHGGGWNSGVRDESYIVSLAEFVARHGYAFASISYRLDTLTYTAAEVNADTIDLANPAFTLRPMTNAMHDARSAIRYFRKEAQQYRIDDKNIFMGGDSAGGFTSILVAYHDKLDEIPGDTAPRTVEGDSGNPGYSSRLTGVWFGCSASIARQTIESSEDVPLIAGFYSTGDQLVSPVLSAKTIQRARDVGMTPRTIAFENGVHCSWLIPVLGFVDLVNYGITLKDALYDNLVQSTAVDENRRADLGADVTLNAYPLPFYENLTVVRKHDDARLREVDYDTTEGDLLKVYDISGRLLRELPFRSETTQIDGGLPAGVHLLVLERRGIAIARMLVVAGS